MFRTTPVTEPDAPDDVVPAELIPISYIQLDLPAPLEAGGWHAYLAAKGIEVLTDDLGRLAVSRGDARQLFVERREAEARHREVLAERDRQAIESDRRWRAQVWTSAPAVEGVPAATLMLQSNKDAQPKRTSPLEEALAGETMTYHAWPNEGES